MLSYQHIYHAGNKADVHKHLWLIRVLQALGKRNEPLFWLDTHAGRGLYDLSAPEAQKLGEYREGFLEFRDQAQRQKSKAPEVSAYLKLVEDLNKKKKGYYPGSALIAAKLMPPSSPLHLYEMHKGEIEFLKKALKPFPFARVEKADGYAALESLLPPIHKAGGVLIDPSYEIKTEYGTVLDSVRKACKAWPHGVFMVWYPILKAGNHLPMLEGFKALRESGTPVTIDEQLFRDPASEGKGMAGTGMVIINSPC
jgi:23S rRNA (adenine2030-N6)-methyltransferase